MKLFGTIFAANLSVIIVVRVMDMYTRSIDREFYKEIHETTEKLNGILERVKDLKLEEKAKLIPN